MRIMTTVRSMQLMKILRTMQIMRITLVCGGFLVHVSRPFWDLFWLVPQNAKKNTTKKKNEILKIRKAILYEKICMTEFVVSDPTPTLPFTSYPLPLQLPSTPTKATKATKALSKPFKRPC